MKTLFPFLAFILATASYVAHAESGTANMSGPLRLTDTELDGVTAGAVAVDVDASAVAISNTQSTYTETNSRTHVVSLPTVEIGFGTGQAYASGGEVNSADVSVSGYGDGGHVRIRGKVRTFDAPQGSLAVGMISVSSR
jgi:hypothetical protein